MSNLNLNQHPDTVTCRHCSSKKVKTFGKISNNGRTVWVDEFGERWYGSKCPACYKKYKEDYDEHRRIELGHRPIGSISRCQTCDKNFIVKVGSIKNCPTCKGKNTRKQMGKED